MNPNPKPQPIDPERVAALLTQASEELDGATVAALKRAREAALERQLLRKPVFALSMGHHTHWLASHSVPQWAAASILCMAVLAGLAGYWHYEAEHDISQTDVALLTDDLPLEIFVDH
ncbi:MAG: hypothetical protein A3F73_03335 [Gallionellales bacterium RIFCSPLOWO2_12_FULL_59_22]|nr:MAG: hypothetical protein A3H99_09000 [Gallionellales bacterium RIFCSPLOWO2_02_FULL_59_110]OGT04561.1 MAG: hypothetical protein A2Z65_13060 [Gallionellales bacterium RIFCSPLOWO2_02_58_13]OGT14340.1 MAG: hypothetical protein A3F73_03335 [Gallionellales bacterium RIFCSPLOWO2_12_FULL_59_22]